MQFEAIEARSILLRQQQEVVEIRYRGRLLAKLTANAAAKMCRDRADVWGVGNERRIRYLTVGPEGVIGEDSRTTAGKLHEQKHHLGRCAAYGPEQ